MNYREVLDYLNGINEGKGIELSLEAVRELAELAGNPQDELRVIHIAGTNGKGSVGNYICNILALSGYTVGRYISPALFDYCESIQRITGNVYGIQHEYITHDEVAENITYLSELVEEMRKNGHRIPSAFEIETVMAYRVMKQWNVDVAVVEVGMGGRLDATNIIKKPVLSVITSIDMDHMQYLGNTLIDIAREKYGIVKTEVPVVSIAQEEDCLEELRVICRRRRAPLYIVNKSDIRPYEFTVNKTSFIYKGEKYETSQAGIYQISNASIAIEAVNVLYERRFRLINLKSIHDGLMMSRWRGRFDIVSYSPFVIVDGAHNPSAARVLKYSLNTYFPGEKFNYIIGVFADKDYEEVLKIMLPQAERVYTIKAPGERGLDEKLLADKVTEISNGKIKDIQCKGSVQSALSAIVSAHSGRKTVVFGSLSFLHEVYEYFK